MPLGSIAGWMLRSCPLCLAPSHALNMGWLEPNHSWLVQGSANGQLCSGPPVGMGDTRADLQCSCRLFPPVLCPFPGLRPAFVLTWRSPYLLLLPLSVLHGSSLHGWLCLRVCFLKVLNCFTWSESQQLDFSPFQPHLLALYFSKIKNAILTTERHFLNTGFFKSWNKFPF